MSADRNRQLSAGSRRLSVQAEPVTSVLPRKSVVVFDHEPTSDEEALAALGYKAEFKREFSLWTTFCVSFAVLGLLPSFASTLYFGMGYAGTAGMVWGWIIAMIFIQCVAMGMAELCSSMPTSGGLYYAAAVLAPPGYGPLAAWVTGWANWFTQITGAPSVDYALASMILAAVSIGNPNYIPKEWETWLLTVVILCIHAVISSMPTKFIAQFNSVGSTLNIIFLGIVIVTIPAATNRPEQNMPRFTSSKEVWGTIANETDFPDGIAILMSFVAVIWTMSGYDAPFHLSEECSNANIASPRAIVLTSGIGGLFGWLLQLVTAYTVIDIPSVIGSDLGQPWAAYLLQVLPQKTALAMLGLTICCGFSMGQGCMVAASRVTFAYARDDCFPLSKYWKRVNRHTQTPVNAVWFNTTLGCLLVCLIFGGQVAINAIFSIGALSAFVAFTIPITIRTFFVGDRFRRGPWHLGRFSPVVGTAATCFTVLMIPILCLPSVTGKDLNPSLMNWTCLVWGGPMAGVMIWWVVSAHKWFKGPQVNIEHAMIGDVGNVIEAKESGSDSGSSSDVGGSAVDSEKKAMAEQERVGRLA